MNAMEGSTIPPNNGIFLPAGYTDPNKLVSDIVRVLNRQEWIANCYIVNYYTQNLWNLVPPHWQSFLENLDSKQMIELPESLGITEDWPQDLAELVLCARAMALPRNPKILKSTQSYEEQEQREIDQMKEHVDSLQTRSGSRRGNTKGKRNAAGQGKTTVQEPSDPDEDDIDHLMRLFMSGKKQHEVVRMGVITKSLTDQTQVKTVLDIGSGEGYLSRVLSWYHSLNVIAIDGSTAFTEGAEKRSQRVSKAIERLDARATDGSQPDSRPSLRKGRLFHVAGLLDPQMDPTSFNQFIAPVLDTSQRFYLVKSDLERLGIVGLHCCGDLTPTMMRMFLASEDVKCLSCVSCCYFRMQPAEGNSGFLNFPLSGTVKSLTHNITWDALRVACESVGQWSAYSETEYDAMVLDSWRRFYLDCLIKMQNRKLFNCNCAYSLRRFNSKAASFSEYVSNAVKKMKLQPNPSPGVTSTCLHLSNHEKHMDYIKQFDAPQLDEMEREHQADRKRIGAFYALRVVVGSLLESLILLDRYLMLKEHPNVEDVRLLPIFEEAQSPRNMILLATKRS